MRLNLFSKLIKTAFTHFSRLKTNVNFVKLRSYEKSLKCLHEEFERKFYGFKVIKYLACHLMWIVNQSNQNCSWNRLSCNITPNWSSYFSTFLKLNSTRLCQNQVSPNLKSHTRKIIAMFTSSYNREQVFSTMELSKKSVRNRLVDHYLASLLLRISSSQFLPDYERHLEAQSSFVTFIFF